MSRRKILIIEDDREFSVALCVRLRANGYEPLVASDGVSAVSAARKERPDAIILDLGLPAGDGFVVMDRLKGIASTLAIPVIVLTARDRETNKERVMKAGARAFLQKPVENKVLLAAIRDALGESVADLEWKT